MFTEVAFSSHANLGQCLGVEHLGYIFSNVFVRLRSFTFTWIWIFSFENGQRIRKHSPHCTFSEQVSSPEKKKQKNMTGCPLGIL